MRNQLIKTRFIWSWHLIVTLNFQWLSQFFLFTMLLVHSFHRRLMVINLHWRYVQHIRCLFSFQLNISYTRTRKNPWPSAYKETKTKSLPSSTYSLLIVGLTIYISSICQRDKECVKNVVDSLLIKNDWVNWLD